MLKQQNLFDHNIHWAPSKFTQETKLTVSKIYGPSNGHFADYVAQHRLNKPNLGVIHLQDSSTWCYGQGKGKTNHKLTYGNSSETVATSLCDWSCNHWLILSTARRAQIAFKKETWSTGWHKRQIARWELPKIDVSLMKLESLACTHCLAKIRIRWISSDDDR